MGELLRRLGHCQCAAKGERLIESELAEIIVDFLMANYGSVKFCGLNFRV